MSALSSVPTSTTNVILLQSSTAQSCLPLLRDLIKSHSQHDVIVLCSLYAPSSLVDSVDNVRVFDWTTEVPGYSNEAVDWYARLNEVEAAIKGALTAYFSQLRLVTSP